MRRFTDSPVPAFASRRRARIAAGWAVTLLLATTMIGTGCAGQQRSLLRLQSLQSGQSFAQRFDQAYFADSRTGEYEIVLIDDGQPRLASARDEGPLEPEQLAPLRQVVHIRLYWRPASGTRPDHPSATNAAIDWYVTPSSATTDDRLHYQGAGFVQIYPKGDTARVYIRAAQLSPVQASGDMVDPLGHATLEGSIAARRNDTAVAAVSVPSRMESLSRVRPANSRREPGGN